MYSSTFALSVKCGTLYLLPLSFSTFTKNFKYTAFIAAAFYYQNMQTFFAPKEEDGVLVFTLPATSNITAFDVNDIGGVSAAAFKKPESVNHMFVPCSADHFSPAEFVELVGKVTGKKTKLNSLTFEQYAGLGFPGAEELAEMFRWFNAQSYYGLKAKRELGLRLYPQLKTMKQWLEETKRFKSRFRNKCLREDYFTIKRFINQQHL